MACRGTKLLASAARLICCGGSDEGPSVAELARRRRSDRGVGPPVREATGGEEEGGDTSERGRRRAGESM